MSDEKPATVLLVEDDEDIAALVQMLLKREADVQWVGSAEAARERIKEARWDLLIVDINLPGINGIEFIQEVRGEDRNLAALIFSANATFDSAVAAIRAGADDYLRKPIEYDVFTAKVREMVELTATRRRQHSSVVLAVGAHPDDVEIGVGGILLRHAAEGDAVSILTLTGGEAGGVANDRMRESERAAELIGARLHMAALPDTSITENNITIREIRSVIEEVAPTIVYTHTPQDVHQDHRSVNRATLVAARRIPRIFCYQAPSTNVEFRPTRFVGIDRFIDRKLEVIRAFNSQVEVRPYLDEELLRATARYWARFSSNRYVEPLEVVRDSGVADEPVEAVAVSAPGEEQLGVS